MSRATVFLNFCALFSLLYLAPNFSDAADFVVVELDLEPPGPIIEEKDADVTLVCRLEAGGMNAIRRFEFFVEKGPSPSQPSNKTLPICDKGTLPCYVQPDSHTTHIKSPKRTDSGKYFCKAITKDDRQSISTHKELIVYSTHRVKLQLRPQGPVNETPHATLTLTCQAETDNLSAFTQFTFYKDGMPLPGQFLPERLPDCNKIKPICYIDLGEIVIKNVNRTFHGNYSCRGENAAGSTPSSPEVEFIVHYPPGQAALVYEPNPAMKHRPVTLSCNVKDEGRPHSTTFRWKRGNRSVPDVTTGNWSLEQVTFPSEDFTCYAVNEIGEGKPATIVIKVEAPPHNLTISHSVINIAEGKKVTQKIVCSATADPAASYEWKRENEPSRIIMKGKTLSFDRSISKKDAGYYVCTAQNKHGNTTIQFRLNVLYGPYNLTVSKTVVDAVVGNGTQMVMCSASANPEPTYQWTRMSKPSSVIKNGKILNLNKEIMEKGDGDYICQVSNKIGRSSVKTHVNIMYPPHNMKVSTSIVNVVEESQNIPRTIVCSADARPKASYRWKRENEPSRIVFEGNTLALNHSISKEDGGYYICEAYNKYGNKAISVLVAVMSHKDAPVMKPSIEPQTPVNEKAGINITLVCQIESGKPHKLQAVEWYRDNTLFKNITNCSQSSSLCDNDTSKLFFKHVNRSYHGNYTCKGKNDAGWGPISPNTELTVYYAPENITVSNRVVDVLEGDIPKKVVCNANAHPKASYKWIQKTKSVVVTNGNTLMFNHTIAKEDGGIFVCEATNLEGNITIETNLNVMFPSEAQITLTPPTPVIEETDTSVTLKCQIEPGNPNTLESVLWYQDGKLLREQQMCYRNISKCDNKTTELTLRNVNRSHQGNYSCKGKSKVVWGRSSPYTELVVYFKPVVNLSMDLPTKVKEEDGRNATLVCHVESGNPPTLQAVKWYCNNKLMNDLTICNSSISACETDINKLFLRNVNRAFLGNYSCKGKNEAGWGQLSPNTELIVYSSAAEEEALQTGRKYLIVAIIIADLAALITCVTVIVTRRCSAFFV